MLASAGYIEPSLVFLTATDTLLTNGAGAAKHLKTGACAVAAVDGDGHRRVHGRLRRRDPQPLPIAKVDGVNFSSGKPAAIVLYRLPAS